MLNIQHTRQFINGLVMAGIKPYFFDNEFREATAEDMLSHFSYATGEELLQACEILKNSKHWPSYVEIEDVLNSLRKTKQMEPETVEDAYPEGEAWESITRSKVELQFPQYRDTLSETSLTHFHWYFQEIQHCGLCKGKDCSYSGHKPRLRMSENGREVYPCVEKKLCAKYTMCQRNAVRD